MEQTPEKGPTAPTQRPGNPADPLGPAAKLSTAGDELWTRAFLIVFCGLSGLIAALLAYFYFQRPEALASVQLEDALLRADQSSVALCLYHIKALQYNVRLLIALRFLGMFIGAQSILLGALFLLKGIETNYQFHLTSDRASSSMNTSSPGLVLITLGVALVAFTQFHDQELLSGALPSCGQLYATAAPVPSQPPRVASPGAPAGPDGGTADLATAAPSDGGSPVADAPVGGPPKPSVTPSHRRKTKRP